MSQEHLDHRLVNINELNSPEPKLPYLGAEFDPFNHAQASVQYVPADALLQQQLRQIVSIGWNISPEAITGVMRVGEAEFNSRNFPVATTDGIVLLKESLKSLQAQLLAYDVEQHCISQGVPMTHPIETPSGNPLFIVSDETTGRDRLFRMYQFIDGIHFDGSQAQLVTAAQAVARLENALRITPAGLIERIKDTKGEMTRHDTKLLKEIALYLQFKQLNMPEKLNDFDKQVLDVLDELLYHSNRIEEHRNSLLILPRQVIHGDLQPYNTLFYPPIQDNSENKQQVVLYDFDFMVVSQRARDIAYASHRLTRVYGERTETKQEIGVNIAERLALFLREYHKIDSLTAEEVDAFPLLIADSALSKIVLILNMYYRNGIDRYTPDFGKQVTLMKESGIFNEEFLAYVKKDLSLKKGLLVLPSTTLPTKE